MRVLTWNLYHGQSKPASRQELLDQFADKIATWDWDVALLQEVPPWFAEELARRSGAEYRSVMTSRNFGLFLRRAIARKRPDLIKSNGGGCNVILSRQPIVAHTTRRVRVWPERRYAHGVVLADGTHVYNIHASTKTPLARDEMEKLADMAEASGAARLIVGGDLNLRGPSLNIRRIVRVVSSDVDHIFVRGFAPVGPTEFPDQHVFVKGRRVVLSDHRAAKQKLRRTGTGQMLAGE
jgi:endonuclease/exonuclease/phosphatase family metal-dependent hydrolase